MTALISGALGVLGSPLGRMALAFAIAWAWSSYRTDAAWRARVAAERAAAEAAYRAEVARQEQAAREIAAAATKRAEDDAALADELRRQIAEAERAEKTHDRVIKGQPCAVAPACGVDGAFAGRVRRIDAAARKGAPTRRAGHVR